MASDLLEPVALFQKTLKKEFHQNAETYFEELVKKGLVDVDANKRTVGNYKATMTALDKETKKANKAKTWKAVLIAFIVLFFIAAGVFIYFAIEKLYFEIYVSSIIAVGLIGVAIALIVVLVKKVNKTIKKQEEKMAELKEKAEGLLSEAYAQMIGLNRLFDWNSHVEIMRRTTDMIKLDPYFNVHRLQYLHDRYGLEDEENQDISTDFIMSGVIAQNPFLIVRQLNKEMGQKTYQGSLVISWVETYRDSEGHVHTTTRTQTLYATVSKPAPYYDYDTFLVYGNDAAPDLHFSRSPSNASGLSEKAIAKKVKRGEKELKKKTEKGTTGDGFTRLSNSEFDVLFGALDRDNEVQFRLLFTPLAQKSLLELIKTKTPYGDDFSFIKNGPLNFIMSAHSQNQNYYGNPTNYMSYDLEDAKAKFVSYNDSLIQSIYYDLAPLLCIPLYQQHEGECDHVDKITYVRNYTSYEEEALANAFDPSLLKHPNTVTPIVLKANFIKKCGDTDMISILAHSYAGIDRIDYVPVRGGDGNVHNVPVPWIEYIPLENETIMITRAFNGSKADFDNLLDTNEFQDFLKKYGNNSHIIYQRGLMALLVNDIYDEEFDSELTNILKTCRIN